MPLASRLPAPPPEFCGREAELDWLEGRLAQHAVVVVAGLPGSGKTSLLAALARQVSGRTPVRWSDCHDSGTDDLVRAVRAAQREGALLVVDNLHRLGAEGGRAVVGAAASTATGSAVMLAAGRELPALGPIEGSAAARLQLAGLGDEAAAGLLERLLGHAAREMAADRAMTGGHPLALRLLAELSGRGLAADERTSALASALGNAGLASLLEGATFQERRLLEALAILAPNGAVRLEFLELCAGPGVALSGLLRRCLIEGDDESGYRLAPAARICVGSGLAAESRSAWESEIARAYARAGDLSLAHEHHCRSGVAEASLQALLALAPELGRQERYDELLERVDRTGELASGAELTLLRARTLASLGRLRDALAAVKQAREKTLSSGDKSAEARLLLCQSDLHRQGGEPHRALRAAWDALQKSEETNEPKSIVASLERLSLLLAEQGEYDKARALMARARAADSGGAGKSPSALVVEATLEERDGRGERALVLYSEAMAGATEAADRGRLAVRLAEAAMAGGDLGAAGRMARSALSVARRADDRAPAARALALLGAIAHAAGRFDEALAHLEQALSLAGPDSPSGALALLERGEILRIRGDYRGASRDFGRAMAYATQLRREPAEVLDPIPVRALAQLAALAADRGEYARAAEHYRQALDRVRAGGTGQPVGLLLCGLAAISRGRGEFATAAQLLEQAQRAVSASHRSGTAASGLSARVLLEKAALSRARGDCRAGLEHATAAADLATVAQDPPLSSRIAVETAGLFREIGDSWKAMHALTPALASSRAMGDRLGHALCLLELGRCHQDRGEYARASRLYRRGLLLAQRLDAVGLVARFLNASAHVEADRGNFRAALLLFRRALRILRGLADKKELQRTLGGLADLHRNRGEHAQAMKLVVECLALAASLPDRPGMARAMTQLADLHFLAGRRTEALEHHARGLTLKEELGDVRGIVESLTRLARVHSSLRDHLRAEPLLRRALELAREHGLGRNEALLQCELAAISLDEGRLTDAESRAGEALAIASNLEFAEGLARGYRLLGLTAKRRGRIDASQRQLNRALKYFKRLRRDSEIDLLVAEVKSLGRENLQALLELRSQMLEDAARLERDILERHGRRSALLLAEIGGYVETLAGAGVETAMEMLEREDATIVTRLMAHGGAIVTQAADRILARFDKSDAALAAAGAIRTALETADGAAGPVPDVRLALHTLLMPAGLEVLQGQAVGLLGRLAASSGPGSIVMTREFRDSLTAPPAAGTEEIPAQRTRAGEAPLAAYRLGGTAHGL